LIVDTWQKLRIKLAEVKPEQGVDAAGTATWANGIKPPSFDGFISWTLHYRQFKAVAEHNCTAWEKATHLLATLQVQASDILHDWVNPIGSIGFCVALVSSLFSHNATFLFSMVWHSLCLYVILPVLPSQLRNFLPLSLPLTPSMSIWPLHA
jgi:hypothetical protein